MLPVESTISEVARGHPKSGAFNLAAGRLFERELHGRLGNRARFPDAWGRVDRKKLSSWM